ncbi:MAG: hypothetical protein WBG92_09800 [Thiohalocapsa sp.]
MSKASLMTILLALIGISAHAETPAGKDLSYEQARWHPLHFKPASEQASNEECLACHAEVLANSVRAESPAGVKASEALAWYETLDTYAGEEDSFHRRHLATEYANQVMDLKCNTCHLGNDPREETGMSHADGDPTLTMRKQVDPNICLLCHGQFPYQNMGVPGPWLEYGTAFQNNCLLCHVTFRTNRHNVNYLKPAAIEKLATEKQDVCFGCHGGRPWYRISYPYPRHSWPGMVEPTPEWAKGRPTDSKPRFLIGVAEAQQASAPQSPPTSQPAPSGQDSQPPSHSQGKNQ